MSDYIEKPGHYFSAPRREMLSFIPPSARKILEIGCGDGRFGAEIKRIRAEAGSPVEVAGVELMPESVERAHGRLDRVLCGNIENDRLDLPANYFDCIVFNDVLEHLVNPWQVLRHTQNWLTPTGTVVASIPNVRFWGVIKGLLFDADWRYTDEGVLDETHLRFFTRRSIERMFAESGWKIRRIEGINSRVRGLHFDLLRLFSFGRLHDIRYLQFAVVAERN